VAGSGVALPVPVIENVSDPVVFGASVLAVMPCIWPVFTSSAAYKDSIPWRSYSKAVRSASGRERQHGIKTVQSLNRRLLIDAKDRRVLRRIQVQANDVGGFFFETWIVGRHVAVQPVRLQSRLRSHPLHGGFAQL